MVTRHSPGLDISQWLANMSWDLYEFSLFWLLEDIDEAGRYIFARDTATSWHLDASLEVFCRPYKVFPPWGLLFILLGSPYLGYCKLPIKYSFGKRDNFNFQFTCIIIDLFLWVPNLDLFHSVLHGLIWVQQNTATTGDDSELQVETILPFFTVNVVVMYPGKRKGTCQNLLWLL